MHSPEADLIVLDTLGKFRTHGHGLSSGHCRICRRYFKVPMPVLIAERGVDSRAAGMCPLTYGGDGDSRYRTGEARGLADAPG
jgi:hypothetical protein